MLIGITSLFVYATISKSYKIETFQQSQMPSKGNTHRKAFPESTHGAWRDSLQINRDFFEKFESYEYHSDWLDPILGSVRQKLSTLCGDDDNLDLRNNAFGRSRPTVFIYTR
jgi:hypothetical protein